jgi:hypothetical protein
MTIKDSTGHALPSTASQSASGLSTPDLVADEKDQRDEDVEEKELDQVETSRAGKEKEAEQIETSPADGEEYPTGKSFVFILISLILSVFLVALDMVSQPRMPTKARY